MRQPETAINTYTGRVLDLAEPQPDQIDLEDIGWGLSRICRFGAQALQFYSVAQHAVTVCDTVQRLGRPDLALGQERRGLDEIDIAEAAQGKVANDSNFRPVIRVQVPPKVYAAWQEASKSLDGDTDAEHLAALLDFYLTLFKEG